MCTYVHVFNYYTVCYFTFISHAVVRQISMLFIDNKDSVLCIRARDSPLRSTCLASAWLDLGLSLVLADSRLIVYLLEQAAYCHTAQSQWKELV